MSEMTFRLNSPLTEEDWNLITDAEFEHSDSITFTTPSGKEVEFRKVVHGEWEVYYDEDSPQDGIWKCSICSYIRLITDISPTNYCPNCGAKMDERREDGEIH